MNRYFRFWILDFGSVHRSVRGIALAGMFLFSTAAFPESAIRVITYNIHHGEGTDGKLDLDRIAAVINAEHPDVVCLQEIDRNLPRTNKLDFPAILAQKLNMQAVFEANYLFDGGEYGNATLTRFPVESHQNFALPGPAGKEPRGCLRVTIKMDGGLIDVLNTHLGLDRDERKLQISEILKRVRDLPTILAGDFNETAKEPALTMLLEKFRDAEVENPIPGRGRIDYILTSGPFRVTTSRVLDTPETAVASDHLPILAELQFNPEPGTLPKHGIYDTEDHQLEEALESEEK